MSLFPMKYCSMCRLSRPENETVCRICGNQEFHEGPPPTSDDTDSLIALDAVGEAYLELEKRVRGGEETFEVARRMAWLSWALKDFRAVEVWSHEARRLNDASSDPHLLRGLVFRAEERWHEAWEEFRAGLNRREMEAEREGLLRLLEAEARGNDPEA
jgi:hypothetical protein